MRTKGTFSPRFPLSTCHQVNQNTEGEREREREKCNTKEEQMGADDIIATNEDPEWSTHHARTLDLVISTVSSANMPLENYLSLLRSNGTFIQVGAPDDSLPSFSAFALIAKGVKLGGSTIGSPTVIKVSIENRNNPLEG